MLTFDKYNENLYLSTLGHKRIVGEKHTHLEQYFIDRIIMT